MPPPPLPPDPPGPPLRDPIPDPDPTARSHPSDPQPLPQPGDPISVSGGLADPRDGLSGGIDPPPGPPADPAAPAPDAIATAPSPDPDPAEGGLLDPRPLHPAPDALQPPSP